MRPAAVAEVVRRPDPEGLLEQALVVEMELGFRLYRIQEAVVAGPVLMNVDSAGVGL